MRLRRIRLNRNFKKVFFTGFLIFIFVSVLLYWKNDVDIEIIKREGYVSNVTEGTTKSKNDNVNSKAQKQLIYISNYLKVKINPITNEKGKFFYNLEFTNTGSKTINRCCWTIYFYSSKFLNIDSMNQNNVKILTSHELQHLITQLNSKNKIYTYVNIDNKTTTTLTNIFRFSHVEGYTFKFSPNNIFNHLKPGDKVTIRVIGNGWIVSKSDFFPNWYVANDKNRNTKALLITSTRDQERDDKDEFDKDYDDTYANNGLPFVGDFETPESKIRFLNDLYKPITAQERFKKNWIDKQEALSSLLIPTPLMVKTKNISLMKYEKGDAGGLYYSKYDFDQWSVKYDNHLEKEALYLRENLGYQTLDVSKETKDCVIVLKIHNRTYFEKKLNRIVSERNLKQANYDVSTAYQLSITPKKINIIAVEATGIFYGVTSFLHLVRNSQITANNDANKNVLVNTTFYQEQKRQKSLRLPCVLILDAARFGHRGLMMDVSRNFQSLKSLHKLVEVMAMYKLNVLHLHLADDEAWRLEIPALPELTQVGACRGHNPSEYYCLISFLGYGPGNNISNEDRKYYSVSDFQAFLLHATKHHVRILPEFDMPSHSHAALLSMKARYRRLMDVNKYKKAQEYVLHDVYDQSSYMTGQFYKQSAINPCLSSTYRFVKRVISSVVDIYKDHNPLPYFHLGGDEVSNQAFTDSPACKPFKRIFEKKTGKKANTHDLKTYFVRRVAHIAMKYNLSVVGWQDAFNDGTGDILKPDSKTNDVSTDLVAQYYYNQFDAGYGDIPHHFANHGMKVILSPVTHLYFDNPQEPNPEDDGLHWASRYLNTKRVFSYTAQNILNSMTEDFAGNRVKRSSICVKYQCLPLVNYKNILGIEAALWSELVRTERRMHQMIFPRLLAVAERAWSRAEWEEEEDDEVRGREMNKDWSMFSRQIGTYELKKLEELHIKYYIPKPGASISNGVLYTNVMFPGMRVMMKIKRRRKYEWVDVTSATKLTPSMFPDESKENGTNVMNIILVTTSYDGKRKSSPVTFTHQVY